MTAFAPYGCPPRVFHDFLDRLAQASSAGRFTRLPIGPIGSKLTLTDDKWAAAVEVAIGRALSTFIVHSFADQKVLMVGMIHLLACSDGHQLHILASPEALVTGEHAHKQSYASPPAWHHGTQADCLAIHNSKVVVFVVLMSVPGAAILPLIALVVMQHIAKQAGVNNLSVYICNYDWPLPDMQSGRIPLPPAHLTTVLQVR